MLTTAALLPLLIACRQNGLELRLLIGGQVQCLGQVLELSFGIHMASAVLSRCRLCRIFLCKCSARSHAQSKHAA